MKRIGILAVAAALGLAAGATSGEEQAAGPTTQGDLSVTAPEVVLQEASPAKPAEIDSDESPVREKLARKAEELSADEQSLEKVLNYIAASTQTNISVNWRMLEGAGVDRNKTITMKVREVPWEKALTMVLDLAGSGSSSLAWTISDGVVEVSTREDFSSPRYQAVHVYDASAFLWSPEVPGEAEEEHLRNLLSTIENTVRPDTWRDNGGFASIRAFRGFLIVNQTRETHRDIQKLLGELAKSHAITVRCYPVRDLLGDAGHERTGAPDEPPSRPGRVQALIGTIEKMVAPNTWQEQNGTQGSISEFDGRLFIRTTNERHQKIVELLAQLRRK